MGSGPRASSQPSHADTRCPFWAEMPPLGGKKKKILSYGLFSGPFTHASQLFVSGVGGKSWAEAPSLSFRPSGQGLGRCAPCIACSTHRPPVLPRPADLEFRGWAGDLGVYGPSKAAQVALGSGGERQVPAGFGAPGGPAPRSCNITLQEKRSTRCNLPAARVPSATLRDPRGLPAPAQGNRPSFPSLGLCSRSLSPG